MTVTLRHRGPDDSGSWSDPEAGVALGHRRLSIIDLSPLGHQPMLSPNGRFVIVFNGEIYNFPDLRGQLERAGHRFRGHSDTAVLLAAIEEWGFRGCLGELNGMFAFALWDRRDRLLHLARDRAGEKPLFYGWFDGIFGFASELKALRCHPRFRGEVDRAALALYMRHGYVPAPHSIFAGIHKLEPGTTLTLGPGDSAGTLPPPSPYWSARAAAESGAANPLDLSPREAADGLGALLADAVGIRMHSDVPLGAFLSGGIDSSTVVALMQAQSARPVRTFSIGFRESGYNEADHAANVARHLGTEHTELYVSAAEARAVIPQLAQVYDEPFGDSSQIPTLLVSRLARQHVTVALSGDGGDELFGGYSRYEVGRRIWRKARLLPRAARRFAGAMLGAPSARTYDHLARPLSVMLPRGFTRKSPGQRVHQIAQVLAQPRAEGMYQWLVSHWREGGVVAGKPQVAPYVLNDPARWPALPGMTERMMYLDLAGYLPDDILVKVDRASMAVGLEARVPLLDHRVIEFAWRLPLALKVRGGVEKWVLREVLARYVPRPLTDRPKMGFGVPVDHWLRGPLRAWAEELLDPARLLGEGYFNPAPIREKWEQHLAGTSDWHHLLWDVLMFQAWLQNERG